MSLNASSVLDWITVLRVAEKMRFSRTTPWDGQALWFCEYKPPDSGPLHRDIILDGEDVYTKPDADV
jgi:hypothetical protein